MAEFLEVCGSVGAVLEEVFADDVHGSGFKCLRLVHVTNHTVNGRN
jgi:hypothetical protein